MLIFSQPDAPKIRNIGTNATVALHLNSSAEGGDIAILTGTAEVIADGPKAHEIDDYVTKYERGFGSLGMTPEEMAASYSLSDDPDHDRARARMVREQHTEGVRSRLPFPLPKTFLSK